MTANRKRVSSATKVWTTRLTPYVVLVVPVALVLLLSQALGEGYGLAARIDQVSFVGPVAELVRRSILALYFPPFLVEGWVDSVFVLFGLYLVFGFVFLLRRRWLSAAVVLAIPLVCSWAFSAAVLGD